MIFLSISSFRNSLKKLLKVKKGEYISIKSEISNGFYKKQPDEIFLNRDMIYQDNAFKVTKLRLPNNVLKLSKRDGYRQIALKSTSIAKTIKISFATTSPTICLSTKNAYVTLNHAFTSKIHARRRNQHEKEFATAAKRGSMGFRTVVCVSS